MSIASVGLRDGTEFEHYVMHMRRTATIAVVNDLGQVLLWRHRFIASYWGWECPAGTPARPRIQPPPRGKPGKRRAGGCLTRQELVMTFQPMIGNADSPQDLCAGAPDKRRGT